MAPIVRSLPSSIAASIGRSLTRHSYLEWLMAKCLHTLLEISIKQGRIAFRLPRPHAFAGMVKDLLSFHHIHITFDFAKLTRTLDAADRARNILAHSVLLKHEGKVKIQIVAGSWDFPQDVEPVKRSIHPETPVVDRTFLSEKRKAVENGIKMVSYLERYLRAAMNTLHDIRRKGGAPD